MVSNLRNADLQRRRVSLRLDRRSQLKNRGARRSSACCPGRVCHCICAPALLLLDDGLRYGILDVTMQLDRCRE